MKNKAIINSKKKQKAVQERKGNYSVVLAQ